MPYFREEKVVQVDKKLLFSLVSDVKSYPDFIPGCNKADITQISETEFKAKLFVAMGPVRESYTSRVTLTPYERVEAKSSDGPFSRLRNTWIFKDTDDGVLVSCEIDCDFKSFIISKLAGPFFRESSKMMMKAFLDRAKHLEKDKTP